MNDIDTALILAVESNENKGGGGGYDGGGCRKNLEEEAIKCVKSWRKYGGKLKDIDIIAMCVTNNPPSQETIDALEDLGVGYEHQYYPITDGFPAGWWNVPLVGKIVEKSGLYDFLIHIDLDITLIRELDERIFWHSSIANLAKCAVYSKEFPDDSKYIKGVEKSFVTCIISSWTSNAFYTKWFDTMMDIWSTWELDSDTWWNYCNIEEHAVDYMFHKLNYYIAPIEKAQIGNDQGYDTLDSFTDDELERIYFLHNHFDNPEGANRTILDYFQRVKDAKKI
jgi:hypothetical protein